MLIGVPLEAADGETRVAVTPETAKKLKAQGHELRLQSNAGRMASAPDAAYEAVGVQITDAPGAWACDLILKVRTLASAWRGCRRLPPPSGWAR
jgi:NAD(P) transhydrogenase subunit alpha